MIDSISFQLGTKRIFLPSSETVIFTNMMKRKYYYTLRVISSHPVDHVLDRKYFCDQLLWKLATYHALITKRSHRWDCSISIWDVAEGRKVCFLHIDIGQLLTPSKAVHGCTGKILYVRLFLASFYCSIHVLTVGKAVAFLLNWLCWNFS